MMCRGAMFLFWVATPSFGVPAGQTSKFLTIPSMAKKSRGPLSTPVDCQSCNPQGVLPAEVCQTAKLCQ